MGSRSHRERINLRGFFGLLLNKTMPFGTVRGDEGHMYTMVRAVNSPTLGAPPIKVALNAWSR